VPAEKKVVRENALSRTVSVILGG